MKKTPTMRDIVNELQSTVEDIMDSGIWRPEETEEILREQEQ